MTDLNHFTATARLGTEPKIHRTEGKTPVARMFTIINDTERATAVNVVAFGKEHADFVESNLHKGSKIAFEGELSENKWEKDGVKHSSLEIVLRPGRSKLELLAQPKQANGQEPTA